jgi:group I intron endonuclease
MQSAYSLYIATNVVNGMQYVGLTAEYRRRLISHKCAKTKSIFHTAIKEYGFENFVFSHIADAFDLESACALERMLIQQHNTLSPNGYNMTIGGQVGPVGYKHSAVTKTKIGEANRNRNQTVKNKFAKAQLGKQRDADFRANASAKMKEVWAKRKQAKMAASNVIAKLQNKENSHGE